MMNPDIRRTIWVTASIVVVILFVAGLVHVAFRTSEQLYINMRETNEKQTKFMFELDRRIAEMERKLAVFEANLKYEAEQAQEKTK